MLPLFFLWGLFFTKGFSFSVAITQLSCIGSYAGRFFTSLLESCFWASFFLTLSQKIPSFGMKRIFFRSQNSFSHLFFPPFLEVCFSPPSSCSEFLFGKSASYVHFWHLPLLFPPPPPIHSFPSSEDPHVAFPCFVIRLISFPYEEQSRFPLHGRCNAAISHPPIRQLFSLPSPQIEKILLYLFAVRGFGFALDFPSPLLLSPPGIPPPLRSFEETLLIIERHSIWLLAGDLDPPGVLNFFFPPCVCTPFPPLFPPSSSCTPPPPPSRRNDVTEKRRIIEPPSSDHPSFFSSSVNDGRFPPLRRIPPSSFPVVAVGNLESFLKGTTSLRPLCSLPFALFLLYFPIFSFSPMVQA